VKQYGNAIRYAGMRIPLAAVGFTSVIAQIVLMRELVATFYGNELLFGLVLMAWLAWVALGSWGLARPATRLGLGAATFATGLILAGLLLLVQIALIRDVRTLLRVTPGAYVEFGLMVEAVILVLAPLCLLIGFLFTLGARLTNEQGGTGGQAYAWESIGAVVGGGLFSLALIHWLDPFQTALLVASVNLVVALRLWLSQRLYAPELTRLLLLCALVPLLLCSFLVGRLLHHLTLGWQWSDLAFAGDSAFGRLIIQARDGQRVFFVNGLLAFETQGTFPEEVAHFPLLAHPDPHRVLLIGGGVAGDLREILKHPISGVTYVELDPLLIEAARAYLPAPDVAVLDDTRVTLVLSDGRLYVKQHSKLFEKQDVPGQTKKTASHVLDEASQPYDVIILDLPEPSTGALNRFYTREFFAEVQAILNSDGVFALGLPSADNYWSPELSQRNGSIYHTLRTVFPEVLVLPGEHNFLLASDTTVEADPNTLTERLERRNVETRWVTPDYIKYVFTTDRFAEVRRQLEAMTDVRLNRDLTPICYYYDLVLWFSRFYPSLAGVLQIARVGQDTDPTRFIWIAAPLALGAILIRWRRRLVVPVAVAGIGLTGMTLQLVLLFAFQVLHGYVYAEVSLMITAYMAGLALGAACGNHLLATWSVTPERRAKQALLGLQLAIAIYSGVFVLLLHLTIPMPVLIFPLLALLAGGLGGMAFPLALALIPKKGNAGRAAGMLYGADLVGGCLGALAGAVFLIPVLGIPQTCAVLALIALAGLLVLV
jgi:spermidine synthase